LASRVAIASTFQILDLSHQSGNLLIPLGDRELSRSLRVGGPFLVADAAYIPSTDG
jgi:hypothetical protein